MVFKSNLDFARYLHIGIIRYNRKYLSFFTEALTNHFHSTFLKS